MNLSAISTASSSIRASSASTKHASTSIETFLSTVTLTWTSSVPSTKTAAPSQTITPVGPANDSSVSQGIIIAPAVLLGLGIIAVLFRMYVRKHQSNSTGRRGLLERNSDFSMKSFASALEADRIEEERLKTAEPMVERDQTAGIGDAGMITKSSDNDAMGASIVINIDERSKLLCQDSDKMLAVLHVGTKADKAEGDELLGEVKGERETPLQALAAQSVLDNISTEPSVNIYDQESEVIAILQNEKVPPAKSDAAAEIDGGEQDDIEPPSMLISDKTRSAINGAEEQAGLNVKEADTTVIPLGNDEVGALLNTSLMSSKSGTSLTSNLNSEKASTKSQLGFQRVLTDDSSSLQEFARTTRARSTSLTPTGTLTARLSIVTTLMQPNDLTSDGSRPLRRRASTNGSMTETNPKYPYPTTYEGQVKSAIKISRKFSESANSSTFVATILDPTKFKLGLVKTDDSVLVTSLHSKSHFMNVVTILAQLQRNDHFVKLLANQIDSTYIYITKYYPLTVGAYIHSGTNTFKQSPLKGKIELCAQLFGAIQKIHDLGAVHLSISSSNAYIEFRPAETSPTLILGEFGMSRFIEEASILSPNASYSSRTRSPSYTSTPTTGSRFKIVNESNFKYAAPETFSMYAAASLSMHGTMLQKADVYSGSVMMNEILTGEAPWSEEDDLEKVETMVTTKERPSLDAWSKSTELNSLAKDMIKVINQGWADEPASRPSASIMKLRCMEKLAGWDANS